MESAIEVSVRGSGNVGKFSGESVMKRFDFRSFAVSILSPAVLLSATFAASSSPPRPNFILCMADDQGWGDVGYSGNPVPKTPTLDDMASSGLRFDRFYAAAPVCSPTRGSVLTGRHPNRFGCFSWGYTLRPREVTVAEALKRAGYVTGHFGKWHLGSVRSDSPVCPGRSGFDEWFSSPNFYENDPLMSRRGKVVETKGESSMVTVREALKFIRRSTRDGKPFLAVIWFGNPHTPHTAPPELCALYKNLPPKLQKYYGEITGIDRAVALLRRELRELGIAGNTLLWYTSDNGPRMGSTGGLSGKKGTLWEGGIRVPAIIEWPDRIKKPAVTTVPCGTVDIYPTLLEIAGVTVPDQPPLDGTSLVSLMEGKLERRPKPLGFWVYPVRGRPTPSRSIMQKLLHEQRAGIVSPLPEADRNAGKILKRYPFDPLPGHAAWIDGRWKLHRIAKRKGKIEYLLFDLVSDPKEKKDLSKREPERTERMKSELEAWQKSVIRSLNGEDYKK